MIYTILDTETSGLPPKDRRDDFSGVDILSFAYAQINEDGDLIKSGIRYLWEDDYNWTEEACKVNGLTKEFLKHNCGDVHNTYQEMFGLVSRGWLVTYNGDSFDLPLITDFLGRHAVQPQRWERSYDLMRCAMKACGGGRRISLINTCAKLDISEDTIKAVQQWWFGETSKPHDASYDVAATFLCLQEFRRLGYVPF